MAERGCPNRVSRAERPLRVGRINEGSPIWPPGSPRVPHRPRGSPFMMMTRATRVNYPFSGAKPRRVYTSQLAETPSQPVIFGAMSLAVRVTCLEALGILLYSICALAKMEGLAAISLQIDVVPDFNLNGERIRWVTEQSIRTSVSRPGTRIREVPWVTWKRSRNSWSGGHPLLSFCLSIDDSCKTRFRVS